MHSWSGVYCVRHDGDDPDRSSGRLTFINPHAVAMMFIDPSMRKWDFPYNIGVRSLRLSPGQLVLFSSWLLHEVLPYKEDTQRLTVAF